MIYLNVTTISGESKNKFTCLTDSGIKSMWPIIKNEISFCKSKDNLDEKILFAKTTHL